MIAYLRGGMVVWIGDPPPLFLQFDEVMPTAVNAVLGRIWNGSAFVVPPANSEQANVNTIQQQAEAALAVNRADITTNDGGIANNDAWLAANTGANLTTTVLTARVKVLVQQSTAAARQRNAMYRELNGVIRLLLDKLDGTN